MADLVERRLGEWTLTSLDDGGFRLDGGAMFGVVPKALWSRAVASDELNRIAMRTRPLLARGPAGTIVIEAGLGEVDDDVFADRFVVDRPRRMLESLAAAGVAADEVDHVVMSHIHWDHADGLVRGPADRLTLTFPNATHHVVAETWRAAFETGSPRAASYHPNRLEPIEASGRLRLVDEPGEIVPGVELRPAGGHCEGHSVVLLRSEGRTACFLGDLVPMAAHMPALWVMAYDMWPMKTIQDRRDLLTEAEADDWLLYLYHDAVHTFGRVARDKRGDFAFAPVDA